MTKYKETFSKDKPLIAQVVAYYPPHLGGMERVAKTISEEITKRGYPVRVITSDCGLEKAKSYKNGDLSVNFLRCFEFAHTPITPTLLWHLLKLPRPSVIHLHLSQAYYPEIVMFASKLRKIPYVVHFHLDVGPSGNLGWMLPIYKKYFLGTVLRNADKIIVFSQEQKKHIIDKYNLKENRIEIIPNGVSEDFFYEREDIRPSSPLRILSVGRLSPQKRVDRLIKTLPLLKFPVELTIVGDGEERAKLEELVKALGLSNVTFAGKQYEKELITYYRNADVFVITSEKEGMPLAVMEAMASGLPIIGSDVIGTHELVQNVGLLVKDPDPKSFAESLTSLHDKPEILTDLSARSKAKAQQYSWSILEQKLECIYNNL